MTTTPNTCPKCAHLFPDLDLSVHDHLVLMPHWSAAEVMEFVVDTLTQATTCVPEGHLATQQVYFLLAAHLGDDFASDELLDRQLLRLREFVSALDVFDDFAGALGMGDNAS